MTATLSAAQALQAALTNILGDLVDLVTLDGSGLKPSTRAAVVIQPPEVQFPTFEEREMIWTLAIVAGPPDRPLIAWERLDPILTALEESGLNLRSATPATYGLAGSGTLPAYEVTLNPLES